MGETVLFLVLMAVGYLAGSVCSAVIVCRLFGLPDPRTEGSNNPGATNVLRIAGKEYAAMVLFADMLKGLLPVLLAKLLGAGPTTVAFTCLAAVIGHMWPVFFGFQGGKGVATALGGLFGIDLVLGAVVTGTWLLVANFSRRSSLASLISMALMPIFSLMILRHLGSFPPLFLVTMFIFYKHRTNISRLIDGTEPRIGTEKKG
ncbi:transmembrane protein [Legionella geestiana]|uniref:Glycerol-3-phosphate acyltransferase n=1 Tax=Legionella geestiana TaxID=45065 RepID=A0A0W0U880_9GAMM|nr:transmembrane protein [Legionella geestiana]QBS12878.1 glycerol-3-phosphate 1-O-acyltransferase [Legionella geestiana]QDQ39428.1 glycerol-3-phosphate 1-O-acyltransferase PlsY [Legionella geestiana]STX54634.1 transmembrane protein [Legionella geestiana]